MEPGSEPRLQPDGDPEVVRLTMQQIGPVARDATVLQATGDILSIRIEHYSTRPVSSIKVDPTEAQRAKVAFAVPGRLEYARQVLSTHSMIVLSGKPGIGRRTAALNLLAGCTGAPIRELLPDWSAPDTRLLPLGEGERHLLDLTYEEDDITERFGRELLAHADNLASVQAYLVVTVSPERWHLCSKATLAFTVELDAPYPDQVLRVHLQDRDRSGTRLRWLEQAPLAELVAELKTQRRSPHDMADLAGILMRVESIEEEFERVRQEMDRWDGYLRKQLGDASSERSSLMQEAARRQRALLIACAVLDGCPSQTIFRSADQLLAGINAAPSPKDLLTGPEMADLVGKIDADHRDDTISILSKHPGLDMAVLDRVWSQRPQFREPLLAWLEAISSDRGPAGRHLDRVATVLTRLAVLHRSLEVLDVIEGWLSSGTSQRRLAIATLEDLAVSPDIGAAVRRRLRQWAARRSSEGVVKGVATVCGGKLGQQFLPLALLRLRLIGQRDDLPQAREAVASALRSLAQHDDLRLSVMQQVVAWLEEPSTRRAGSVALLALLDPSGEDSVAGRLLAEAVANSALQEELRKGWSLLLADERARPDAERIATQWITSADTEALDEDSVVEILETVMRDTIQHGVGAAVLYGSDSPTRTRLVQRVFRLPSTPRFGPTDAPQPTQG